MVRTFLKVYMELGSYFLFLQEQIKDIIIKVIAREGGYTYIAALRSPDLRHMTKREGDTSVTSVTNKNLNVRV